MTVVYTNEAMTMSRTSTIRLLCRWRGSLWKTVYYQLSIWLSGYFIVAGVYHYALYPDVKEYYDHLVKYCDEKIDVYIPLTFILGFYVSFVIGRWETVQRGIGWIDSVALSLVVYCRGSDTQTVNIRRKVVRYVVLSQALVLRDCSLQVKKRFPTLDTLRQSGFATKEELDILTGVEGKYYGYWLPLQWAYTVMTRARDDGHIKTELALTKIQQEIHAFQEGLKDVIRFDWVPVPLIYPQVLAFAVRFYFFVCIFSRQILQNEENGVIVPLLTIIQFVIYMGWLKVAEMFLNPLGTDDDDLECNYILDQNLVTGLQLVDRTEETPSDIDNTEMNFNPLYTEKMAQRHVTPLIGSAYKIEVLKGQKSVKMVPHRNIMHYYPGDPTDIKVTHSLDDLTNANLTGNDAKKHSIDVTSLQNTTKSAPLDSFTSATEPLIFENP